MPPGEIVPTTWGEVGIGSIVRDEVGDRLRIVIDQRTGWVRLRPAHGRGEATSNIRPPDDCPVDVYVPSEAEAIGLLQEELGARLLRDIEEREHTRARALNFRVDPIARRAPALQNHIDMLHGVNVDDVLRKWAGTEVNPSSPKKRKDMLDELCRAHDEMHEDPATWPQALAHHHALIGDQP